MLKVVGGLVMSGVGLILFAGSVLGSAQSSLSWPGIALACVFLLVGLLGGLTWLPRMFAKAEIQIIGGRVVYQEQLGARQTRLEWLLEEIESLAINQELVHTEDMDMDFSLSRPLLRLRVLKHSGEEALILYGRRKEELVWTIDVLTQQKVTRSS